MCMGSGSETVVEPEVRGDREDRREHSRLSIQMVILMNFSKVLPSSRQASSNCNSADNPFRYSSFSPSSAVTASRVSHVTRGRL